jgi:hypothetical protein
VSFGVFDLVNRYKKGVLDYMALVVVTGTKLKPMPPK